MSKLTKAQRVALQYAVDDGGVIELNGLDSRPVRRDVAMRLYERGLFEWTPGALVFINAWRITPAGRAALSDGGGE